jgi:hypothetical protein
MNKYIVLKAFEQHTVGDTVSLNARQAKYLVLNGSVALKAKESAPDVPKKAQAKAE